MVCGHCSDASVARRLTWTLAGGLILSGIATGGLVWFQQSEWFHIGVYPPNWEGYTLAEFMGLLIFVMAAPAAFMLVFTSMQLYMRRAAGSIELTGLPNNRVSNIIKAPGGMHHLMLTIMVVITLMTLAGLGMSWGWELLQCGVIACVDTNKWKPYVPKAPEAGIGWQVTVGLKVMMVLSSLDYAVQFPQIGVGMWIGTLLFWFPCYCSNSWLYQWPSYTFTSNESIS
jgi:hypothetical protein